MRDAAPQRVSGALAAGSFVLAIGLVACGESPPAAGPGAEPGTGPGAPSGTAWFEECSAAVGLDFEHVSGHIERCYFPEIMTTGAALFDADGDGDLDAYLVQGGSLLGAPSTVGNVLFLNDGTGHFVDVSAGSGADDRGYGMGVATGDYDGDGDLDLYVSNLGRNTLLRNDGGGHFTDVTEAAGVGGENWSAGAAFVDYDGDGDLDLFVASYVYWSRDSDPVCQQPGREPSYCGPITYDAPTPDTLFRNDGDGTFTDVSREVGIAYRLGNGLGVVCADFDGDGRQEIFVANDGGPNFLWRHDESGQLKEMASVLGCAVDNMGAAKAGMGVVAADFDRDGDEDLLVVNLGGENDSLFRNDGGRFMERTSAVGLSFVSRRYTRFGVALVDFDHDGHLDAFHANGRVSHPVSAPHDDPLAEPNALLRGTENGRFELVDAPADFGAKLVATSRAAAFGDIDGDGDIDVLVHNKDGRAHLLRNTSAKGGNWTQLRIVGKTGGDALGATVLIRYGGATLATQVRTSWSYCAASSPILHLGLGAAEAIDEVVVRWPDGAEETFGPLTVNELHTLTRKASDH